MNFVISDADLLRVWEQTAREQPARRAFALLAGLPDHPPLEELTVGQRDRLLLLLRGALFGDLVEGLSDCPSCGSRVEIRFSAAEIAGNPPAPPPRQHLQIADCRVTWRLPTCADLLALADLRSPDDLRKKLLSRCLLEVVRGGDPVPADECPQDAVAAVCSAMSESDPHADIRFQVNCPDCGTAWESYFDIAAYLWREIDARAASLLREVHRLSSAYGWSEPEILAINPLRRRLYLELLGA